MSDKDFLNEEDDDDWNLNHMNPMDGGDGDEMGFYGDEPIINVNVNIPPIHINVFPDGYAPIVATALQEHLVSIKQTISKCTGNDNNVELLKEHYAKVEEVYHYFCKEPDSEGAECGH